MECDSPRKAIWDGLFGGSTDASVKLIMDLKARQSALGLNHEETSLGGWVLIYTHHILCPVSTLKMH